jgi:ElaB/YqjD/DUF883 family membrane-anchored ribosome-binding protein
MAVSEKAKEKLDEAGKEIREAVDSLRKEVTELTNKVRDKLKGTGEEVRESAEELVQDSNFRLSFCMWQVEKYLKISKLSSFFS